MGRQLIIAGRAKLADGGSWSFSDPSLTTWEARELASWLQGVLAGDVEPAASEAKTTSALLVFTEPNLAFSLAGREAEGVTLRCHLSLESRPPWLLADTDSDLFDYFIEVTTPHSALAAAADELGPRDLGLSGAVSHDGLSSARRRLIA